MHLFANAGDCAELLMCEVNLNILGMVVVGGAQSVSLCVL